MLCHFSCIRLFVTPWTTAHQASLSMGFSRQGYWNGLPYPPPGDLLNPGIKPVSLRSPVLTGRLLITGTTWEAPFKRRVYLNKNIALKNSVNGLIHVFDLTLL